MFLFVILSTKYCPTNKGFTNCPNLKTESSRDTGVEIEITDQLVHLSNPTYLDIKDKSQEN